MRKRACDRSVCRKNAMYVLRKRGRWLWPDRPNQILPGSRSPTILSITNQTYGGVRQRAHESISAWDTPQHPLGAYGPGSVPRIDEAMWVYHKLLDTPLPDNEPHILHSNDDNDTMRTVEHLEQASPTVPASSSPTSTPSTHMKVTHAIRASTRPRALQQNKGRRQAQL